MSSVKKVLNRTIAFVLVAVMLFALIPGMLPVAEAATPTKFTTLEGRELYSWSFQILELMNRDRAKNGRKPLVMDAKLMEYATQRAFELYLNFDHTRPNGQSSPYTICPEMAKLDWMGENISMKGYAVSDPARVNDRLYQSDGHRKNMLETHFSCVGIGCVYIEPWVYVVELFGGPKTNTKTVYASQYKDVDRVRAVEDKNGTSRFVDVPTNSFYNDPVNWAVNKGITNGTSATTFSPNATCTRGQVVTFLWRAHGSPEPKSNVNPFKDVPNNAFYYKAALWAKEQGITAGSGTADKFAPNEPCTRAHVVTFLWRSHGSPAANATNPYTDVPGNVFYSKAVLWAVDKGITKGTGGNAFEPNAPCSRAQIVTFLYRDMGQ